jgi:hypothetical protein
LVHLRRALLLFAIVLGMAALVASLSRPIDQRGSDTTPATTPEPGPPTATPGRAPDTGTVLSEPIVFEAAAKESKKVPAGDAATVEVAVSQAGTVEIPDMGLSSPADPVTPARFDVLPTRPGRYELTFIPARGEQPEPAGSLVVTSRG